jgi:NAD(P)-dependent dehydrogenase (short-subunit alcohol dehydrogenase family)/rhamnose utilization protein RhaD (predicted bifunctional aldolase and dehydrogenase)
MAVRADDIDALLHISHSVGRDPELIAGAGGNTSVKDAAGRVMWVKASGTTLAGMGRGKGYVEVNLDKVLDALRDPALTDMPEVEREERVKTLLAVACTKDSPKGRPSVETMLHAVLDRYVVHTHPAAVCGLLVTEKGARLLADRNTLVVPYIDPGYPLAVIVAQEVDVWRSKHGGKFPPVILMENHGLITCAANPKTALALTQKVLKKAQALVKKRSARLPKAASMNASPVSLMAKLRGALFKASGHRYLLKFTESERTRRLLAIKGGAQLLAMPLVPDQIAYTGIAPLVLSSAKDVDSGLVRFMKRYSVPPKVAVIPNAGYIAIAVNPEDAANKTDIWRDVERLFEISLGFGGPRSMGDRNAEYIAGWEAEKYRIKLLEKTGCGLLQDRVALVTGAASGLGRGIAMGFLKAGAYVTLVDISAERLAETKAEAEALCGPGRVLAIVASVTDEAAVKKAFAETVLAFGGVDILLNAASIAPSYGLMEFPADVFRKSLELNLTGYLLCAKEAARLMIEQGIGGSIINLSSKTGLDASKNNSAYNATKAGEIHLARGWALELGQHNIRVNSLAPGNVFKGSLIWNKEYIKACAKKRGIKPEEVIPYYIGLTALKQEIMPDDVANAAVFLASDMASKITGQTIVPDAGQVFVR